VASADSADGAKVTLLGGIGHKWRHVANAGHARQAGGHWFEPSTAHHTKALLRGAFFVAGNVARLSQLAR
jgi:hypothetical protein